VPYIVVCATQKAHHEFVGWSTGIGTADPHVLRLMLRSQVIEETLTHRSAIFLVLLENVVNVSILHGIVSAVVEFWHRHNLKSRGWAPRHGSRLEGIGESCHGKKGKSAKFHDVGMVVAVGCLQYCIWGLKKLSAYLAMRMNVVF
jgi:hypothetical protein